MKKRQLLERLEQELCAVTRERQAGQADAALKAARQAVKRFQQARLAVTHADLLAQPDTAGAAAFFLDELYGAHDLSQRDIDLARIIPTMGRMLPYEPLHAITEAIVLDALSEQLDTAMARALGEQVDATRYAAAYRSATARADRERQLALVDQLGTSLCTLVRIPMLSMTLKLMRQPARVAGLGDLQRFLETGFSTFKQMRQPAAFVATIVQRERDIMERLFGGETLL